MFKNLDIFIIILIIILYCVIIVLYFYSIIVNKEITSNERVYRILGASFYFSSINILIIINLVLLYLTNNYLLTINNY